MSSFQAYFQLGIEHILDVQGIDHMLFVVALMATCSPKNWKSIVLLVTAFTIGHSITLALAVLWQPLLPSVLVETLIPITILITAIQGIWAPTETKTTGKLRYSFALFFGLIHGMGFSNYLTSLLGKGTSVAVPLLAFNLGVEVGQLIIVAAVFFLLWIALTVLNAKQRDIALTLSGGAAGIAITFLLNYL